MAERDESSKGGKGQRPAFVSLMYHTESPQERPTEVGALWPRKDGKPGFIQSIKPGLSLSSRRGVRLVHVPPADHSNRPRVGGDDD
jgi:hypothetical protein